MKTIITYTLIFTIPFPTSIFASQHGKFVNERLEQGLIAEEVLREVMLIAEDGVVEQEELENLFLIVEERSIIKPLAPVMGPCNCVQYSIWFFGMTLPTISESISACLEGDIDSCSWFLYEISLLPIRMLFYCWFLFFPIDPLLKILFFMLDSFIGNPFIPFC